MGFLFKPGYMPALTPELKKEYELLFNSCVINPNSASIIESTTSKIANARQRYESVSTPLGVPWYFTGIVHFLEGGGKFDRHLHNGDPLTAKTKNVPANRPPGNPTFEWETSATDALTYQGLNKWKDWSVAGMLYQFERYNGFGYRVKGIHSPYLWSFSNHYVKGKFVKDGLYDPEAVSKQIGAAVLLRRLSERQLAVMGELDTISRIKALGATVKYAPAKVEARATELQTLLNSVGLIVKTDGKAGERTSSAYFSISGKYLSGDPRAR
jgi:lysozyme family protein